jgi:hypothetical protein
LLRIEDCIALSTLTEEEIDAIAEAKHVPEIIAAELGAYLLTLPDGTKRVSALIQEDIATARLRGDLAHAAKLRLCLQHFLQVHAPRSASI